MPPIGSPRSSARSSWFAKPNPNRNVSRVCALLWIANHTIVRAAKTPAPSGACGARKNPLYRSARLPSNTPSSANPRRMSSETSRSRGLTGPSECMPPRLPLRRGVFARLSHLLAEVKREDVKAFAKVDAMRAIAMSRRVERDRRTAFGPGTGLEPCQQGLAMAARPSGFCRDQILDLEPPAAIRRVEQPPHGERPRLSIVDQLNEARALAEHSLDLCDVVGFEQRPQLAMQPLASRDRGALVGDLENAAACIDPLEHARERKRDAALASSTDQLAIRCGTNRAVLFVIREEVSRKPMPAGTSPTSQDPITRSMPSRSPTSENQTSCEPHADKRKE